MRQHVESLGMRPGMRLEVCCS